MLQSTMQRHARNARLLATLKQSHTSPRCCSRRYQSGSSSSTQQDRPGFFPRLRRALKTPVRWAPLPLAGGAALLVGMSIWKRGFASGLSQGGTGIQDGTYDSTQENKARVKGPWQVHVVAALPLRSLSRIYGALNEYTLPEWFRVPGFKLYAWIFGVNLSEAEIEDLKAYRSLSEFFMRRLKANARPISEHQLVSPADGRVVNFGYVENRRIEQVKGVSYSLDNFLSGSGPGQNASAGHIITSNNNASQSSRLKRHNAAEPAADHAVIDEEEFANINGLSYTVDQLVGVEPHGLREADDEQKAPVDIRQSISLHRNKPHDASVPATSASRSNDGPAADGEIEEHSLIDQIALAGETAQWTFRGVPKEGNKMFFCVVYLAPGDYHRFHSPANWVVERRRHFAGELFSVSPYMSRLLNDLFVLNERVALLGRWRHGFFSMTPVGATNVGSIRINFDADLRTNSPSRPSTPGEYDEATYERSSTILHGKPLRAGEEVGVFALGSTIVLLFEAPENMIFTIRRGDKVRVGECLADVPHNLQNYFQDKKMKDMQGT